MSKVSLHVEHAPAAYWASIRALYMLPITFLVDAMAALHEHHLLWGCEHVFTANRAIAVSRALNATMRVSNCDFKAHTASLSKS